MKPFIHQSRRNLLRIFFKTCPSGNKLIFDKISFRFFLKNHQKYVKTFVDKFIQIILIYWLNDSGGHEESKDTLLAHVLTFSIFSKFWRFKKINDISSKIDLFYLQNIFKKNLKKFHGNWLMYEFMKNEDMGLLLATLDLPPS